MNASSKKQVGRYYYWWKMKHGLSLSIVLFALLSACGSSAARTVPTPTVSPVATSKPTNIAAPAETNIPGFEDWSVVNPNAVEIKAENGSLFLTLKFRALWFMSQRGVLVYKPVSGNFKVTADVHTAKRSDPSQPPGGDGTVQLGGLMARNGEGGKENYVFIVLGDDGNGLSIETKNTTASVSEYHGPSWDSAEAELRLCRAGQTFYLYKRHVGSSEAWQLAETIERPDLPDTLQVGANIYSDSTPDLRVQFDHLRIETVSDQTDCEQS